MSNTCRKINEEEWMAIENRMRSFGIKLSGGSLREENGKKIYHVGLETIGNYDADRVGKALKKLLGADEVYDGCIQIA